MSDIDSLFPKRIIDEDAYTVEELMERTSTPRQTVAKRLQSAVASGEWEQVWKHASGRLMKAYRKRQTPQ